MPHETQPSIRTYIALALAGALMILPVGLAGFGVTAMTDGVASPFTRNFALAMLGSSLPEELSRFAVLYFVAFRRAGMTRPLDGLVFAAAVSLGFSVAENLLYGLSLGWQMAALKLAVATPIHLAIGVTMGGLLVIADSGTLVRRSTGLVLALAVPMLLHGVYDLAILGALGAAAQGGATPGPGAIVLPALSFAIVLAYAVCIARRACRLHRAG